MLYWSILVRDGVAFHVERASFPQNMRVDSCQHFLQAVLEGLHEVADFGVGRPDYDAHKHHLSVEAPVDVLCSRRKAPQ